MSPLRFFKKRETPDLPPDAAADNGTEPEDGQADRGRNGLFGKLRAGLRKTRAKVIGGLQGVLSLHRTLDDDLIEEVEEQLYIADVGPRAVARLCDSLRQAHKERRINRPDQVLDFLKQQMADELARWDTSLHLPGEGPAVIMMAGVNGSGKTTTVAKLAALLGEDGKRVLLAASDTFRAAAAEQLEVWAGRIGVQVVKNESADPAAVAFDAVGKAIAGRYDVLIIDTAGRLHTRRNLMMELQKIGRVTGKQIAGAPHETLLVLDATTGQNAVSQAIKFNEGINVTGIVLTKLDGTAKGGVVFGMRDQIDIPVKFVGVGEQVNDLLPFDPEAFINALFG